MLDLFSAKSVDGDGRELLAGCLAELSPLRLQSALARFAVSRSQLLQLRLLRAADQTAVGSLSHACALSSLGLSSNNIRTDGRTRTGGHPSSLGLRVSNRRRQTDGGGERDMRAIHARPNYTALRLLALHAATAISIAKARTDAASPHSLTLPQ